jgi:hypothetical protein
MIGEGINDEDLITLVERQDGRNPLIIINRGDTKHWEVHFNLLVEGNKTWAKMLPY